MEKKIREILNTQYEKFGGNEPSKVENIEEFHNLVDKDYYPYVWFQIQFDISRR